ncbi:hypothetical protein [Paraburkholderia kururiensis]|uniref:hypothetical protein n=1 Tax=Paraburkholderia kururiensis TaxID=984307 RepID=UPI0012692667|nr:hypothetical protein [Paraburkholderia kururiensis]
MQHKNLAVYRFERSKQAFECHPRFSRKAPADAASRRFCGRRRPRPRLVTLLDESCRQRGDKKRQSLAKTPFRHIAPIAQMTVPDNEGTQDDGAAHSTKQV